MTWRVRAYGSVHGGFLARAKALSVALSDPSPGSNGVARAAFGGWSLDTFVLARSVPPVTLMGAFVVADGTALNHRPNVVPWLAS
jgi:hypothetical protein